MGERGKTAQVGSRRGESLLQEKSGKDRNETDSQHGWSIEGKKKGKGKAGAPNRPYSHKKRREKGRREGALFELTRKGGKGLSKERMNRNKKRSTRKVIKTQLPTRDRRHSTPETRDEQ